MYLYNYVQQSLLLHTNIVISVQLDDGICAYSAWATAQMEPTDNTSKGRNSRETLNACHSIDQYLQCSVVLLISIKYGRLSSLQLLTESVPTSLW